MSSIRVAHKTCSRRREHGTQTRSIAYTCPTTQACIGVSMPPTAPRLDDFITPDAVDRLIRVAREEDLGPRGDDITSRLFIPADRTPRPQFRSRKPGRLAGAALLPAIARIYDPTIAVE